MLPHVTDERLSALARRFAEAAAALPEAPAAVLTRAHGEKVADVAQFSAFAGVAHELLRLAAEHTGGVAMALAGYRGRAGLEVEALHPDDDGIRLLRRGHQMAQQLTAELASATRTAADIVTALGGIRSVDPTAALPGVDPADIALANHEAREPSGAALAAALDPPATPAP